MTDYQKLLENALASTGVTGASFAYWDGKDLHRAVAGLRNSVTKDPVTVDTLMHIGSITKVMNAVLLMQLVDDRMVRLDDPVTTHLPGFSLADPVLADRITCGMLLDHSSGINGDWLPEDDPDEERIADAFARTASLGLLFEPGSRASYCNIATVIAGYLVQQLRGRSWYQVMRDRIFEPLGLANIVAEPRETPRFRCSVGDLTDPASGRLLQTSRAFLSPSFAPAGSTMMATAEDVITFARAMINNGLGLNGARILSCEASASMASPRLSFISPANTTGLGWIITPSGLLSHAGAGPGVFAILYADSSTGQALALLTNCDRGDRLHELIVAPIISSWRKPTEAPISLAAPRSLQAYEGCYGNNLQTFCVWQSGHDLLMAVEYSMPLYDNAPYGPYRDQYPHSVLKSIGDDRFQATPFLPGGSPFEVAFAEADDNNSVQFLATAGRLFVREINSTDTRGCEARS